MKTYFRLLSFAKPYSSFIPQYIVLVLFAVIFGILNLALLIPLLNVLFDTTPVTLPESEPAFRLEFEYFKDLFNYHFQKTIVNEGKTGALRYVCYVILVSVLLANLFRYLSQRVLATMRTRVVKNMRKVLFAKLVNLPLGYYQGERKGNLMSVLSNDVQEVETSVVSSIQVVFREPLLIIGYFVVLFSLSVPLTLFTIVFLPVSGLLISTISKKLKKQASEGQGVLGMILSVTEEAIGGSRIIKAFNGQALMNRKFEKENENYTSIIRSMIYRRELASPLSEFMGVIVVVSILLYGGQLVLRGEGDLSASEFITYIIMYSQILVPAKAISSAITNMQRGLAAGERVLALAATPEEETGKADKEIVKFEDWISFNNVSFQYAEKPVLKNINLDIKKGEVVALVGASGAGKSTLADLVARFYDPVKGQILIDGTDIRSYSRASLRNLMGIVTQESILFNDTVFNNIAFAEENVKREEVIAAAKVAHADEFIVKMEQGYDTNIGDRGGKLSGGQRQRISIARAIYKNPPILILDEATSALDTESERLVQEALNNLMKNRTTLVIAHRLSTIQHADKIVVMQQGEIVETGTHDELMKLQGVYSKMF